MDFSRTIRVFGGLFRPHNIALKAAAVAFVALSCLVPRLAMTAPVQAMAGDDGPIALGGLDPMAYFLNHKPLKGSPFFSLRYKGQVWNFSSVLYRATFLVDPEKFAPQHDGLCTEAADRGESRRADPNVWKIRDGKLYLFHDRAALAAWLRRQSGPERASQLLERTGQSGTLEFGG